jgi:hypothetical protein
VGSSHVFSENLVCGFRVIKQLFSQLEDDLLSNALPIPVKNPSLRSVSLYTEACQTWCPEESCNSGLPMSMKVDILYGAFKEFDSLLQLGDKIAGHTRMRGCSVLTGKI